nr:penicillin-binding protein 2 [Planosporangium flavigriseum]
MQVVQGGAGEPVRRGGRGVVDEPPRRPSAARNSDRSPAGSAAAAAAAKAPAAKAPAAKAPAAKAPAAKAPAAKAPSPGGRRTPRVQPPAGRPHAPARSGGTGGVRAGGVRAAVKAAQAKRGAPARRPKRQVRLPEPRRRLRLASVLILAIFVVISGRLVELQLIDAKAYAARGLVNRIERVPLPAPRGTIYDRDRNILAHSVEARLVYADPGMVEDPQAAARQLAPLLGKPVSELLPKLVKHAREDGTPVRFEYLARGVDVAVGEKVDALKLAGVVVNSDERRDVPGHDLAANLIGFTGYDLRGAAGLEFQYDRDLRGVPGERAFEVGGGEVKAEIPGGYRVETPARPGSSLQLTINSDLQFRVYSVLSQQMKKINADFGSAVVLDVKTGEVLAQASYPGYDAAEPMKAQPKQRLDANTDLVVDPGSVSKVIALGGALQEGVVKTDTAIPVGPAIRKGDTTYRDTHPFPEGTRLTLPGILAYSSNVGTIRIADQLGPQKLYEYQRKFGLGKATGEGLPGEASGLIQPPENWSGSSYGSIPIGMGISTTPLQMAAVYAAIANGGVWVQPHLVKAKVSAEGQVTPAPAPRTQRVLSTQTADALRQMLEAVVTVEDATGRKAAVPGYRVAGKTGTGQFVGPNGKYVSGEVGSFIGMAPADAPRYVIAVFAHTPKGEGGTVAAPAFSDMMAFALGQSRVPPSATPPPSFRITE